MSKSKKKDCWDIVATTRTRFRTSFEKKLTAEQAEEAFHEGDYTDIIDEEVLDISSPEAQEDD